VSGSCFFASILRALCWEYPHEVGKCIIGGHVYRGTRVPQLAGLYIYGDYVNGKIWGLRYDDERQEVTANHPIRGNKMPIMSFGEDEQGEVYFMTDTGKVYRFQSAEARSDRAK
jgi:quinoprotein glucose dehydrogenase